MTSRARETRSQTASQGQASSLDRVNQNKRDQELIDSYLGFDALRACEGWTGFVERYRGWIAQVIKKVTETKDTGELLKLSGEIRVLGDIIATDEDHANEIEELRKRIRIRSENA